MYAAPALTFDSFTRTAANAAAVDAARAVADGIAGAPALLVLHGPTGAGKTHLLCAIGAGRRAGAADGAGRVVEYVSFPELAARVAVPRLAPHLAARYAHAEVLLVDDVRGGDDELARDALAQLLDAVAPGRTIVLALDRPPAAVAARDARLARLLAGAAACALAPAGERRPSVTPADVALHVPVAGAPAAPAPIAEPLAAFADAQESIGGRASDYASFLSDVAAAVAQHVEPWKQRLAEASNRWGALGYDVAVLERALARTSAPDVDGLLATYAAAVEHLRRLEAQASTIEPELAGAPAFRDPARVGAAEAALTGLLPAGPEASLTRAAFFDSASSAAAASAADEAAAHPGGRANPLYVYGPPGSGRTHLLSAAANALRGWRAGRVAYVGAAQLAAELADAMRDNTVERWRARYGAVDVLAVDDVQLLAGNARAEQELALLCATLRERGRQLLLAGEHAPAATGGPGEGLRLQIGRGVAARLDAPDRALRAHLVAGYFAAARRTVDAEVLAYVADRVDASAHAVAPAAERVLAAADRAGVPLTLAIARSELGRTPARTPLWTVAGGAGHTDAFFLDPEKVVWDWPDLHARVIEELR